MDENVEVVQNRVSLWQSYKQGVGVALGILTIYVLALALLAFLASKALTQLLKAWKKKKKEKNKQRVKVHPSTINTPTDKYNPTVKKISQNYTQTNKKTQNNK
jgi:uncharacterized membrane protein YhiD involved in acid resistance